MLVLAHLGHWYVSLPIWLGPFVLLIGWAKYSDRRDKSKKHRSERKRSLSRRKGPLQR